MQRNKKTKKKVQVNHDQWDNEVPNKKKKVKQLQANKIKYKKKWLEFEEEEL